MTTAGILLVAVAFAVWGVCGVWVSVIDIRKRILPKRILWPTAGIVAALYLVASVVESEPLRMLQVVLAGGSCGAIFAIIYYIYPEGMGFGDVRLVTVNGLAVGWFGISAAWVGIAAGFLLAFPLSVWFLLRYGVKKGMATQSPFGPFLVVGSGLVALAEATGVTAFP